MSDFNAARPKPLGSKVTTKEFFDFAKKNGVDMVDMKFCDMLGTWQHCTYPLSEIGESAFTEGVGFDGSSIRGWQNIDKSDMVAVFDASTACIDPFFERPTISVIATVFDPISREPYNRDPRHVALRAEAYLKKLGLADVAYFGPEPEFFVFDDVRFTTTANSSYYEVDSSEGAWNTARNEEPNLGFKVPMKGGYFPVSPTDSLQDLRTEMVLEMMKVGIRVEAHHHEVATAGQCEIDMRFNSLLNMGDQLMWYKYIVKNVARRFGKTATFMPKPIFQDNGSGMHVHFSLWKKDKPLFAGNKYAGLSEMAMYAVGGILKHAPAILAITNPTTNSYHRLVPGYEAPVNLAISARNRSASIRVPMYSENPKAKRIEFRCPDPLCNGYLGFSAIMMAALDGIKKKITPGKPLEQDIFHMAKEELSKIPSTPGSLDEALTALENDHAFLLEGGVFTKDFVENWIAYKRDNEVDAIRLRPHPYEFQLYYDS